VNGAALQLPLTDLQVRLEFRLAIKTMASVERISRRYLRTVFSAPVASAIVVAIERSGVEQA
jgi:hypothetical protein